MKKPIHFLVFLLLFCTLPLENASAVFGFHAGSHLGIGRMGNESLTLANRTMSVIDFQFMPGYTIGAFMPGLLLDYRFVGQMTDSVNAGGSDLAGKSFIIGLGTTFLTGDWKILFSYDLRSRHSLSTNDSSGNHTTYKGSGFHLLGGYQLAKNWFFDGEFVQSSYNTSAVGESESDISSNKVKQWNLSFGVSYTY